MADYYGKGRTNTFKVKDVDALKAAPGQRGIHRRRPARPRPRRGEHHCLRQRRRRRRGLLVYTDEGDDDPAELFVPDIIAEHLQDGQVAVFLHAGSEKLRYLSAYGIAVHANGQQVRINLGDIYHRAAEAFNVDVGEISWAAY